jgi:hypothetical protein
VGIVERVAEPPQWRSIILAVAGPQTVDDQHEIAFEAFGVRVGLTANRAEVLERLQAVLPPHREPCPADSVERVFGLVVEEAGSCSITINGTTMSRGLEFEVALTIIDSQLRIYLGINAPDTVFVHAGAVGCDGGAILIPGPTFSGKSTLVSALVDTGMTYYSDEFAVIDEDGLVHPYAKPLSVRSGNPATRGADREGRRQSDHSLESLGWTPGVEPIPLGMIVVTSYRSGAEWRPERVSAGAGAMALLANAVPARERPEQVMRSLRRAAESAVVLKGDRGEAEEAAAALLAELERAQS